ncbi:MAG: VanZ family protein, partial [Clostridia bacterium]|nr:VanZ family protein [Clostridia bacterium]
AIEMSQFLMGLVAGNMYRNVDIDDIILNSFGTFLGYGVYKLLPSKIKEI